ncbi:hypothetical protein CLOM_g17991 [Closterium sp. NIES-68]|nr:hypothetical protein CLOM_g17991 [Closterium sp. NIES-68]GJP70113.1 hypothetical protein CLOP_g1098 [Closterium sp. NIES-67]
MTARNGCEQAERDGLSVARECFQPRGFQSPQLPPAMARDDFSDFVTFAPSPYSANRHKRNVSVPEFPDLRLLSTPSKPASSPILAPPPATAPAPAAAPSSLTSAVPLHERYAKKRMIGQGHFGQVWAVEDLVTRRTFACKSISKNSSKFGETEMKREIAAMKRVSGHDSIVQLQSVHEDSESMHLVMDYCDAGELYEAVERQGRFPEKEAAKVFKQLVSAVAYCHSQGVMHRDLKPENILLSAASSGAYSGGNSGAVSGTDSTLAAPEGVATPREAVTVKLADFGLAIFLAKGEKASGIAGSPLYMAPEVVSSAYDFAADVWSLGVVLYILLCGAPPFGGKDDAQIMRSICTDEPDFSAPAWRTVSAEAKAFVRCLLVKDPARRPPAFKLLAHPWVLVHTRGGRIVRRKVFPNGRPGTFPVNGPGMGAGGAMMSGGFASPLRPRAWPVAELAGTPVRTCGSTNVAAALLSPPMAMMTPAMTPAVTPLLSPAVGVTPILGRIAAMRVAGSPSPFAAPSVAPSPAAGQWVAPSPWGQWVAQSPAASQWVAQSPVVGSPWSAVLAGSAPLGYHASPLRCQQQVELQQQQQQPQTQSQAQQPLFSAQQPQPQPQQQQQQQSRPTQLFRTFQLCPVEQDEPMHQQPQHQHHHQHQHHPHQQHQQHQHQQQKRLAPKRLLWLPNLSTPSRGASAPSPARSDLDPISPCLALARKPIAPSTARKPLTPSSTLAPPTLTHPTPLLATAPTPPTSGEFQLPPAAVPVAAAPTAPPAAAAAAATHLQANDVSTSSSFASACASLSSSSSSIVPTSSAALLPTGAGVAPSVPALAPITPDATPVLAPALPSAEPSPSPCPISAPAAPAAAAGASAAAGAAGAGGAAGAVARCCRTARVGKSHLSGATGSCFSSRAAEPPQSNLVSYMLKPMEPSPASGPQQQQQHGLVHGFGSGFCSLADESSGSVGSAVGIASASAASSSAISGSVSSAHLVLNGGVARMVEIPSASCLRRCLFV